MSAEQEASAAAARSTAADAVVATLTPLVAEYEAALCTCH
jgi:hypothetical protein